MDIEVIDRLPYYYKHVFPFKDFHQWLSYGHDTSFKNREFAFNFNDENGDRYARYNAYEHGEALRNAIAVFYRFGQPFIKIDIGAVYNLSPLKRKEVSAFYAVQKELIFDIDISDYDEVRSCCSGAMMCNLCWKYMVITVKTFDASLREDFGFNNILWTFSGRRGIHCWVCDKKARLLKKSARFGVANFLQVVTGGSYKKKKVQLPIIHPSVKRALNIIQPMFIQMCIEEQDILGTEERVAKFLGILQTDDLRGETKSVLDQHLTSFDKWNAFVDFYNNKIRAGSKNWIKTPFLIEEIILQYAYPRLDINVSLGMSHLLKSPFSVHPKTGKIGVPLDVNTIEEFDPVKAPTVKDIMDDIDKFDSKAKKQGRCVKHVSKIEKTSLKKYMQVFREFINGLEHSIENDSENIDDDDVIVNE